MTRRNLLRVVDIAEILGVSKQRANQLRREPHFPAPVGPEGTCGRLQTFDGGRGPTLVAQRGWGERSEASGPTLPVKR